MGRPNTTQRSGMKTQFFVLATAERRWPTDSICAVWPTDAARSRAIHRLCYWKHQDRALPGPDSCWTRAPCYTWYAASKKSREQLCPRSQRPRSESGNRKCSCRQASRIRREVAPLSRDNAVEISEYPLRVAGSWTEISTIRKRRSFSLAEALLCVNGQLSRSQNLPRLEDRCLLPRWTNPFLRINKGFLDREFLVVTVSSSTSILGFKLSKWSNYSGRTRGVDIARRKCGIKFSNCCDD